MAPPSNGGGISIPTADSNMSNGGPNDDQSWNNAGRSPPRGNEPPRRSSRSRSPGRPTERYVVTCHRCCAGTDAYRRDREGNTNPGNNLHVSGLSHKVDTRDLEQAFAKVGRVSVLFCLRGHVLRARRRRLRGGNP